MSSRQRLFAAISIGFAIGFSVLVAELGLRFSPDLVVLGFFESDLEGNVADFHGYMKPRFYLEDGELVLHGTPIPDGVPLLKAPFELPSFYLGALANKAVNAVLDRTKLRPIDEREDWRITQAIFEAAKRESMEAGAEFLLVDIPFGVQRESTSIKRAVAAWAENTDIHFLSLREVFTELPREKWDDVNDGHFTAMGHAETAKALMTYSGNASLLPETGNARVPRGMQNPTTITKNRQSVLFDRRSAMNVKPRRPAYLSALSGLESRLYTHVERKGGFSTLCAPTPSPPGGDSLTGWTCKFFW